MNYVIVIDLGTSTSSKEAVLFYSTCNNKTSCKSNAIRIRIAFY
jgi:hypothetical protein